MQLVTNFVPVDLENNF